MATKQLPNREQAVGRRRGEPVSTLKEYAVEVFHIDEPEGSYDMLAVTCPNCARDFWVRRVWRTLKVGGRRYVGRACPYCFKASRVPK